MAVETALQHAEDNIVLASAKAFDLCRLAIGESRAIRIRRAVRIDRGIGQDLADARIEGPIDIENELPEIRQPRRPGDSRAAEEKHVSSSVGQQQPLGNFRQIEGQRNCPLGAIEMTVVGSVVHQRGMSILGARQDSSPVGTSSFRSTPYWKGQVWKRDSIFDGVTGYRPQCCLRFAPPSRGSIPAPDGHTAPLSRYHCGRASCRSPAGSLRAPAHRTRSCDEGNRWHESVRHARLPGDRNVGSTVPILEPGANPE